MQMDQTLMEKGRVPSVRESHCWIIAKAVRLSIGYYYQSIHDDQLLC